MNASYTESQSSPAVPAQSTDSLFRCAETPLGHNGKPARKTGSSVGPCLQSVRKADLCALATVSLTNESNIRRGYSFIKEEEEGESSSLYGHIVT